MHVRGRTDKDSCWRDSGLTGIAVSWAALPLICAMYAQAQSKPTGMGIGLSICRSIIEAHEERIWATANMPRGVTLHTARILGAGQQRVLSRLFWCKPIEFPTSPRMPSHRVQEFCLGKGFATISAHCDLSHIGLACPC